MNNLLNTSGHDRRRYLHPIRTWLAEIKLVAGSTLFLAFVVPFLAQAQNPTVKVTTLGTHIAAGETIVSIAADGSLNRAQTWQDGEGYHVVIPNTVAADSIKTTRGLKVRRIGSSLEILVQTKPGARVNAFSSDSKLNVVISGKLDSNPRDYDAPANSASEGARIYTDRTYTNPMSDSRPYKALTAEDALVKSRLSGETAQNSTNWNPQMGPLPSAPAQTTAAASTVITPTSPPSDIEIQPEDDGWMASVFSGSSVLVVMSLGLFGLLVSRRLRSRQVLAESAELVQTGNEEEEVFETSIVQNVGSESADAGAKDGMSGAKNKANGSTGLVRHPGARVQVAGPTSLFGAYRIDQEVGKLVYGQAHRLDVLSSRAIDDRRAIEASLIKSVNSPDLDESGRRKAREALEEYGFVARQCAALLLASDAFERTSAARSLGEIKSPAALPFLLESLYDAEPIVRNQAVMSIGELKLPAAIGALLDIARTHPDVPSSLLSKTLSACSVEGLDFFDAVMPEPALLGGDATGIVEQITHLEPTHSVEDLEKSLDDEMLSQALVLIQSSDVQERAEGLKLLPQFRVQTSVAAMAQVAMNDSEPNLRSLAISSLSTVNHESVFPAILIGMADDSREVRAAAARSLSRLSFDRAEAYVRVIETCDHETLDAVAKACIQAGIVSQNLDRLSTSDHRQAYETFSVICLLAKAKMNQPVLDAIADHPNGDVRIKAVHLLACTGQPEVADQFRELAVKEGMREDVKTALLEALYKLEQSRQNEVETTVTETLEGESEVENTPQEMIETSEHSLLTEDVVNEFEADPVLDAEPNFDFQFVPTVPADDQPLVDETEK